MQGGGSGRGDRLGEAPRATALSFFAFFRAWVSPVLLLVAAMWVPPFHFLSVDFLLPYRLLCNASVSQELFTPLVRGTMLCRHHQIRSAACWALLCVYQCVQVRVSVCGGWRPLFSGWPTPASLAHPGGAKTQFTRCMYLCSHNTHTHASDPHTRQIRIKWKTGVRSIEIFFAFSILVMVSAKHI